MRDNTHAYIAKASCGCLVAVTVDSKEHRRDMEKDLISFIKDGLTIEHHPIEEVRKMDFGHKCGKE
jgi:hypothetical protein